MALRQPRVQYEMRKHGRDYAKRDRAPRWAPYSDKETRAHDERGYALMWDPQDMATPKAEALRRRFARRGETI